jgi:hypothetical protein
VKGDSDEIMYFVDGFDPQHSNWLRYINCASTSSQENVIAIECKMMILFDETKAPAARISSKNFFLLFFYII